ncbi:MAG: hypothetical protein M1517_10245 [Deltaproteobacteria bacterium]|nr:hypothetical protein [Deltaproteobacteria bacterium]
MKVKRSIKLLVAAIVALGGVAILGNANNSYAYTLPEVDNYTFQVSMTNSMFSYLDTQIYNIATSPTVTTLLQGMITNAFTNPTTGAPKALVDTCLSIPLVGMTCIAVYIEDFDNDGVVFTYTIPANGIVLAPNPGGAYVNAPRGTLSVAINLANVKLDVALYTGTAYTQTAGASPTDYVLAAGQAQVPNLSLALDMSVIGGNLQTYDPTEMIIPNPPNPNPGTEVGIRVVGADIGVGFHFGLTPSSTTGLTSAGQCSSVYASGCPNTLVNDGSECYKSCLVSSLIPYVDAEFNIHAADNFNAALEYYLGPTMLLNAATLLTTTVTDPLTGGGISIDAGFFWDFTATTSGVNLYPGGLGLALTYTLGTCVTQPVGAKPITDTVSLVPWLMGATTPNGLPYMLGLLIHENPLSELLYNVYTDGILCMDLNNNTPLIGSLAGSLLSTSIFGLFFTPLNTYYPNRPMQIEVVPTLVNPASDTFTEAIDTPYIETGANITTSNPALTYPTTTVGPAGTNGSLIVGIPHLLLNFDVDTTGTGNYQRVFGLDLGVTAGVGISVWTDPTLPTWGTGSPTGRVIRVLMGDQPTVNTYIPYSAAIPATVTGMAHILGEILPTILTAAINGRLDLAVDIYPLLGITFTVPYIGTAGPLDARGLPSGFGAYVGLQYNLDPGLVFTLLNSLGLSLTSLTGSLKLDAPQLSGVQLGMPYPVADINIGDVSGSNIVLDAKQTKEAGLTAYSSVIDLSSYEANGPNPGIEYSYSLDNGPWGFLSPSGQIALSDLYEGEHTVEVQAVDSNMVMSANTAKIKFDIDSVPPTLSVTGPQGSVNGSRANFVVDASDAQTPADQITVSYKLDNKSWTIPTTDKDITVTGLTSGSHTVAIRAFDLAGNASQVTANLNVVNGAKAGFFGCSTADTGNAGIPAMLIMIFAPLAFVFLLKKKTAR